MKISARPITWRRKIEKLRELQDLFWLEAAKYNVLPAIVLSSARSEVSRPSLIAGKTDFVYFPRAYRIPEEFIRQYQEHVACDHRDDRQSGRRRSWLPAGGTVGGYTLFVKEGKPTYEYNWFGMDRYRVTSPSRCPRARAPSASSSNMTAAARPRVAL
ncbi:MAG: hypothetical protein U1E67_07815 [Hyphomicrobiales bacterium]